MAVRLLVAYGGHTAGAIVTFNLALEDQLVANGTADRKVEQGFTTNVISGGDGQLPTGVKTASFTLALADLGIHQRANSGSAIVITVPGDDDVRFRTNTSFTIEQAGAGAVSIAGGAGVTINKRTGRQAQLGGQYGVAQLIKTASNTWTLFGDLA